MIMSPKQKENVTITWRVIALALLAWWGYELREIKVEIRQSSDHRIQQIEINKKNEERHSDFKSLIQQISMEVKEIKVQLYEGRNR